MHVQMTHPSKYFDLAGPAQRYQSQRSGEVEDPQPVRLEHRGTAAGYSRVRVYDQAGEFLASVSPLGMDEQELLVLSSACLVRIYAHIEIISILLPRMSSGNPAYVKHLSKKSIALAEAFGQSDFKSFFVRKGRARCRNVITGVCQV
jgi:hypothetical protein